MFRIKKYIIHSISLTAFSIILIALITLYGNFELDISGVKVENIDIVEVFVHNFFTMILSIVAGIFTAGFYSVGVLGINIFNIATLSNALYVHGMSNLIPKLVPHGIIELFSLSLCVVYSFYVFVYLIKKVKLIFLRKYDVKLFCKKIGISFVLIIIANTILLSVASVVEYLA